MKIEKLNLDGKKSSIEVLDKVFSAKINNKLVKLKVNHKLIKFVIDWQLNHAKPRVAKTKQRNEIKGSTKKIENFKKVKIAPISLLTPSFDVIFHEEFDFKGLRP